MRRAARRRRRIPRRRFHALHADVLLVLALAAALAAALPAMRAARPERPVPGGFSAAADPGGAAPAADGVSSPLLFAFGAEPDPLRARLPDAPPPPESVLAARPAWDPPPPAPSAVPAPGDGAPAGRPALPVSSLLADLAPAAPLFSARRPPPPAPPENEPAGPVSVARFRGAPDAPPAAVVDAPGADPARLRKLEADAYSELR